MSESLSLRSYLVIPARLASKRLPRKLLLRETGKSVLQHTYEAAICATKPVGVCIAADHPEIVAEVVSFGGRVVMTDPAAATGTDRVAEVARSLPDIDVIVNVQGDEPNLRPESIDRVIRVLEDHPAAVMATLAAPIRDRQRLEDPACVKVVFDASGRALYFSRSPIPHVRNWDDRLLQAEPALFHQHLGIYAYRRDFLVWLAEIPSGKMEGLEKLEQLRVLEAGVDILVAVVDEATLGIDTPEDYRAFVKQMQTC
jgi:3-deoxy-manno-octulosonate cytidylyltransferase (CMP-KDO synthetase)